MKVFLSIYGLQPKSLQYPNTNSLISPIHFKNLSSFIFLLHKLYIRYDFINPICTGY